MKMSIVHKWCLRFETSSHFIRRNPHATGQVIDGFFIVRRTRLAPTTQTNYRYCFQRLTNFLGSERDFASITASDIQSFVDHLHDDGLSDRSVHDNLAICSALWTFAESEFKLPHVVKEVDC